MDPVDFLVTHAPFSELSEAGRAAIAKVLELSWSRAGETILERGQAIEFLYVVRKGRVRLELDGQRIDVLREGEIFGLTVLGEAGPAKLDAVAERDSLLYLLPGESVRALAAREAGFAPYFLESLSARLRALTRSAALNLSGPLATHIGELPRRAPVGIEATATVAEAARKMRAERVSCLLVVTADGSLEGIVTDRDLRTRVLAEERGPDTTIGEVMTREVHTVDADAPLAEALLAMLHERVHHLPVLREGRPAGVLTHTDLLDHQQRSPALALRRIERASSPAELAGHADEMAELVTSLHRGGMPAVDIGRVVSALNDVLATRLIGWAERDLGPAPAPWAWLVLGSEGRHEQSFLTDQDNALVFADGADAAWFEALAEHVVEGLVAAGFPRCEGGFMATNWCAPLERWREHFEAWTAEPDPEALLRIANFFDFRRVFGDLELEPLEEVVRRAARDQRCLAQLGRASTRLRPPLGFARRMREGAEGVDLKAGGILPIVSLARLFALEAGEREGSTLQRLETAARAGSISRAGATEMQDAFRWLFDLRMRRQLVAREEGRPLGNEVRLALLEPRERRQLKSVFLGVRSMQESLGQRMQLDMLG